MNVLSASSIEALRVAVTKTPELVEKDFADLVDDLNLQFVSFNADIKIQGKLLLPAGITQETNKDTDNCIAIKSIISGLNPAQATDERLWTTLCFTTFSDYTKSRWPLSRAKTPKNHVNEHWFAKTNRNRIRDNAISRLWWMAQIAERVPETSIEQVLEILFFNSDYRSSLLERNSSANSLNVLASIIKISKEAFDEGNEYNRESFRSFMKQVDLLGKRTVLPSLEIEILMHLFRPLYKKAYVSSINDEP